MLKLHLAFQWLVTCLCRKYIGQIFTDSLVHDEKALKFLVDIIGEVRHLFQLFSCIYYKYIEVKKQILQCMHPMKFNCKNLNLSSAIYKSDFWNRITHIVPNLSTFIRRARDKTTDGTDTYFWRRWAAQIVWEIKNDLSEHMSSTTRSMHSLVWRLIPGKFHCCDVSLMNALKAVQE